MGIIPEVQRSKLASSVVPAPGVDTSSARLLQDISKATSVSINAIAKANRQKQEIVDATETNKLLIDFENSYANIVTENKTAFHNDPKQAIDESLKAGQDLAALQLDEGPTNDSVKSALSRLQQSTIRNSMTSMRSWQANQQIVIASDNIQSAMNSLAKRAYSTNTLDELQPILTNADTSGVAATGVLGEKAITFVNDGRKAIASAFLHGQIDRDPFAAAVFIQNDVFQEFFDEKEYAKFRKDTQTAVKSSAKDRQARVLFEGAAQNQELAEKYATQELTLGELDLDILDIEDAIDIAETGVSKLAPKQKELADLSPIKQYKQRLEYLQALRSLQLSDNRSTASDSAEEIIELFADWKSISTSTGVVNSKKTLDELVRFQTKAANAAGRGVITQDKFRTFAQTLATGIIEKVDSFKPKTTGTGFLGVTGPRVAVDSLNQGFAKIDKWFKKNTLKDKVNQTKANSLIEYTQRYDLEKQQKGRELTGSEAEELATKTLEGNLRGRGWSMSGEPEYRIDKLGRVLMKLKDSNEVIVINGRPRVKTAK